MMGRVSINREQPADVDTTAVSNRFIDDYMTEANDAQLKIYLYLLRMMRAGLPTSLSDLADRFNLTEKDVKRALKFWEKRGVISMEYDQDRKLSGIHLEELSDEASTEAPEAEAQEAPAEEAPAPLSVAEDKDADCSQLLFIAERYVGRPLSSTDRERLLYIRDTLTFSDALLDYLLQYCVERGKRDFRYIERVAVRWHESGYETPEQAKRGSFKYDKRLYEVMDLLGLTNVPTATEAAFIERWISEYRMPIDIIREACARTVLATQRNRLNYADKIITGWYEAGVTKKSDIQRLDEERKGIWNRRTTAPADTAKSGGTARQRAQIHSFPQRDYDFDLLEKQLIQN